MKVLVACQYGTNKGDRAICEYLIKSLENYGVDEIVLSTIYPCVWKKQFSNNIKIVKFGYPVFSNLKYPKFINRILDKLSSIIFKLFLKKSMLKNDMTSIFNRFFSHKFIKEIKESDVVIVTGGHHITSIRDTNGLYSVTYDMALVSQFAKKYFLWTQTLGPLDFSDYRAKDIFESILHKSQKVYIRDDYSELFLKNNFEIDKVHYARAYDTVFGFYDSIRKTDYCSRANIVGISIFNGLDKAFNTYPFFAYIVDYFSSRGFKIRFFKMEYGDEETKAITNILSMCKKVPNFEIIPFLTSANDHLNKVSECKYYVGYKTHSIIMALTTCTPLLAIAYHYKTHDFMKLFNMDDYCIDDEKLSESLINEILGKIELNANGIFENVNLKMQAISNSVKGDMNELLSNFN